MKSQHINYTNSFEDGFPYLYLRVKDGQMVPYQPSFGMMHWHEELQFLYVESGQLTVQTLQGSIDLQANQAIFINKDVPHLIKTNKTVYYHSFIFPIQLILFNLTRTQDLIMELVHDKDRPIICFNTLNSPFIQIIKSLLVIGQGESDLDILNVQVTLNQLIVIILQSFGQNPLQGGSQENVSMFQMLTYISNYYSEKITLDQIASSAHISQSECQRQFAHYFEISPHQYLITYRLEKAKVTLETSSSSIANIALENGFSHSSHFSKIFKEKYGVTPKQYQKWFLIRNNGNIQNRTSLTK